jgi:type I restriction enzyme S subunit
MSWNTLNLIECTEKITKGTTPTSIGGQFVSEGINFIKVESINEDGQYIPEKFAYIDERSNDLLKRSIIFEDDILISIAGAIGRTAYVNFKILPANTNQALAIVRPKKDIVYPKFLYYAFRTPSYQGQIKGSVVQAAQANVSLGVLNNTKINLPNLATQRKIASILSAYDDLIENNLKRIKLLEEKAFLRYKGIVREVKELKKLPLAHLATVTSSKRIFLSDYVDEGIPFYRSKEIIAKSNFESIEKPLYITEERYTDIKEKFGVPVSGDLLITSVGTIGFVHLVNNDDGDFYFKDGNLIWIKNLQQQNLAYFLFFKFRTPEFKEMLNSVAIGSSQKALTIETVKKIEIEIPNDKSLIEFNKETKIIIKLIYNLQKQNTKLREARDILLPRLMSGEIEV